MQVDQAENTYDREAGRKLRNAAPSLIAELREARKTIAALELAIGGCGCVPGRCEQSPDDALVYYGRICRAARLLQPGRKRHDI